MDPVTGRPRRIAALLACFVCASGVLAGCTNLFAPRTPERPSQEGVPTNYSVADSTLETMARAIEAKAGGNARSAYLGALAVSQTDGHDFYAYFDPAAAARWQAVTGGTLPDPWGLDREEIFFGHLSGLRGQRYDFAWLVDVDHPNDEDLGPTQRLLHRQYVLTALPEGVGAPDTIAIGYADLTFIKSQTADKWVISRWQDRVDPAVGAFPANPDQLSFSARRLEIS